MILLFIEWIQAESEKLKWVPEAIALIGALSLISKTIRGYIVVVSKAIYNFFTAPSKTFKAVELLAAEVSNLQTVSQKSSDDIKVLKDLIGYNGSSGALDKIGYIMGYQSNEFWLRDQPGFMCSEIGENVDCTHAYCRLLGVSNKDDVDKRNWQGFVDKTQYKGYLEEFSEVAKRRENFRRELSFKDVYGNDVGTWLIVAYPISAEKAKTARYIGYLYPYGQKAKEVANLNGWPMVPPL